MNITKQTNNNECGVCVINSLVEHYYHKSDFNKILNEANLSKDGLTIFDFEVLSQKFGIFAETFQLDYSEFCSLSNNEYFVCPIKKDWGTHYVIVKKKKHYLEVFDSIDGKYEISLKNFSKNFIGIIILVSKSNVKVFTKDINKIDLFKHINVKYLLLNLLLQATIIGVSTITADFLNIMTNNVVIPKSLKNGIYIALIFILFYVLDNLVHYLLTIYLTKHFKINFSYLSHTLIQQLKNKKSTFLNKVDKNCFYLLDTSIQVITNFLVADISSFFANVLLSIIVVCIISVINYWFILTSLLTVCISVIFCYIHFQYKKHLLDVGIKNQNRNNGISTELISYLKNQRNFVVQEEITSQLQCNFQQFQKIYIEQSKFYSLVNFLESTFCKILYVFLIMLICYFIVEKSSLNFGQMTLIVALSSMLSSSVNSACDFFIKRVEFKTMADIYHKFISIDNVEANSGEKIEQIKELKLVDENRAITLLSGQKISSSEHLNTITLTNDNIKLYINGVDKKLIDTAHYLSNIFVINNETKISKEWILKNFDKNNKTFIDSVAKLGVNLTNSEDLDTYSQTSVNFVACLLLKNKLIVFNDCFKYIKEENKDWINTHILPQIMDRNYVLFFN